MSNLLFDRQSLKVVGSNRSPLAFEIEVQNIDFAGLSKTVTYTELEDARDEQGNLIYALPQQPEIKQIGREVQYESLENTGVPVLISVEEKVPVLDDNKEQLQYEIMRIDEETGEQIGTGQFIKCYTTEIREVQKTDENGLKLFISKMVVMEPVTTELPDLHVTEDDELFVEGLETVKVLVDKTKIVTFEESPQEFTYEHILQAKQQQITKGSFFTKAVLFEDMDDSLLSTQLSSFNADLGFGFISIPKGGEVRTVKLTLPTGSNLVGIKTETSDEGLNILIGDTASNLKEVVSGEVSFESEVSEVYVKFENPTDKRIDVYSFALLV